MGDEFLIVAEPMSPDGDIHKLQVMSSRYLDGVNGLSFELEYDTFFYDFEHLFQHYPSDLPGYFFTNTFSEPYYFQNPGTSGKDGRYSFTLSDHATCYIRKEFTLMYLPLGLRNKHNLPLELLPEYVTIKLKNLKALGPDGEDLHFGSQELVIPNYLLVSTQEPVNEPLWVFPNPTSSQLYVQSTDDRSFLLYDVHGQHIRTIAVQDALQKIDISDLLPGIYFIRGKETGRISKISRL
jgi:hypothetical protein